MLGREYELISIKSRFFYEFLKLLKNQAKSFSTVVQGIWPNFIKKWLGENSSFLFITFSDTYTCTYVV